MNPASVERKEIIGLHRITPKRLRELCKKDKLYQTPELNDVLYLHYQGFQCIECLEEYTELKCIWLECNAISEIQGLENQSKLKCLFLQNNLIKRIENLEYCKQLDTLNLASNHIRRIENCGIEVLPVLNTLNLSANYLRDSESLWGLEECKNLSVLDLSNNRIDDILVVKVFGKMPQLRVLVLQGNPVVSKIPQYRKTLILECKELTYLDSRPVFPKDRACAEAWRRGGYAEERKEHERWNRKERKKIRDSVNATIRMRNKHKSETEQIELITSSDSEKEDKLEGSDTEKPKNLSETRMLLETGANDEELLLDIWDEVRDSDDVIKLTEEELNDGVVNEKDDEPESLYDQGLNVEKLDSVYMSSILEMVEKPMQNDSMDVPELVCESVPVSVNRKRPLIEEITVDTKKVKNESYVFENNKTEFPLRNDKKLSVELKKHTTDDTKVAGGKIKLQIEEINSEVAKPETLVIKENKSEETKEIDTFQESKIQFLPTNELGLELYKNIQVAENSSNVVDEFIPSSLKADEAKENRATYELENKIDEKLNLSTGYNPVEFLDFNSNPFLIKDKHSDLKEENAEVVLKLEKTINRNQPKALQVSNSLIEEISSDSDISEDSDEFSESPDDADGPALKKIEIKSNYTKDSLKEAKSKYKALGSESEDENETQAYDDAATAICEAVMNSLESHEQQTQEIYSFVRTETILESSTENYEPELEIQKLLDRLPSDEGEERAKRFELEEGTEVEHVKTAAEIKYDEECEDVNRQVIKDFEELTQNMDLYIDEFQRDQQEMAEKMDSNSTRMNSDCTIEINSTTKHTEKYVVHLEKHVQTQEVKFEERKAEQAIEFNVVYQVNMETNLDEHKKTEENSCQDIIPINEEFEKACGDHVGIGKMKGNQPMIELEKALERPSLKAYEQETVELRALLQKLELQNSKLKFVKRTCDNLLESNQSSDDDEMYHDANEQQNENVDKSHNLEKIKVNRELSEKLQNIQLADLMNSSNEQELYVDAKNWFENEDEKENDSEMVNDVLSDIVKHAVEEGEEKPKNYKIIDLESDDDYSYSLPPKPEEPPVKSIRSVLNAFNNLIKDIARKSRDERQREYQEYERKRVHSTEADKVQSLRTLIETPSLLEHHKDSYESLTSKVDIVNKKNSDELKKMVDRVYAQKEKYDDSLEVVDGKLVVIKKETGEIEDIATKTNSSKDDGSSDDESDDSDHNFETAESNNESDDDTKNDEKDSKKLVWDFSMGANQPRSWAPKYRPTMRKSAAQLILNAIESNESASKESDDNVNHDNSEENQFGTMTNVFSNIDREFFKNLDFQKIAEESEKDENFVEVARSYEELREVIKKSSLTSLKPEINIEEREIVSKLETENLNTKDVCEVLNELTDEENILMHKLVQHTKESNHEDDPNKDLACSFLYAKDGEVDASVSDFQDSAMETNLLHNKNNNKTIFELKPIEQQRSKMTSMLNDLQIERNKNEEEPQKDLGNFTEPLGENVVKPLENESEIEKTRANYNLKILQWNKNKMERRANIECAEAGTQCIAECIDELLEESKTWSKQQFTEFRLVEKQSIEINQERDLETQNELVEENVANKSTNVDEVDA